MISCIVKCARSKKEYFRNELNFMRFCCTATPADLISIFGSFLKCASRQTCGALHLLRNKSFLHQPLNKFIRWQINHSKKFYIKMDFEMTLLKYLLFQAWELPVCNYHVSFLVVRASWHYLWYRQWLTPRKMSLYTTVGWDLFFVVFIHSVFVYAGVQSVLTRIFQMRISRIVPNIARKTEHVFAPW